MSSFNQMGDDADIDLPRLGAALWARRVPIAATVILSGLAAFVVTNAMAPLYKGEARILIEERQPIIFSEDGRARDIVLDAQGIASQVEVVRSANLLRDVIDDFDLGSRSEFDPAADASILKEILVLFGLADNPLDEASRDRVLSAFREKLEVYQVQNSRVIGIEVSSEDPQLAADLTNAVAEAYLAVQSGAKLASNANATAWLEPEIASLRDRVREAEAAVAAFRAENGLFEVGQEGTLSSRQLADLSGELSAVRRERADAEARAATVREALGQGRPTDAISAVLESGLIQRLRERQIAIQGEIADLSTTLLENHPQIRGLRSQLAGLDAQIREEVRKALASLEGEAEVARRREEELTAQLDLLKASSAEANSDSVELRALEREATAARELLETYLARYREAVSRGDPDALPADARIIAAANAPSEPYFPKTLPIMIVAMLAAGLVHVIVIMLGELLSGRALKPAAGAEPVPSARLLPMPAPETIETHGVAAATFAETDDEPAEADPVLSDDVDRAVAADLPEAETPEEEFTVEAVAATLLARRADFIVGLSPEGDAAARGTVDLARTLADGERRVLYIDMSATGVAGRMMTGDRAPGITELLCGDVTIADAIHADRLSNVDAMPLGHGDHERAMRAVSRIGMVVEALSDAYDIVVIECGATRLDGMKHLLERRSLDVVLSIVEPDEAMVGAELEALFEAGHDDALMILVDDAASDPVAGSAA